MTKEDLNKLVTVDDLEQFRKRLLADLKQLVLRSEAKEFYSPKEFAHKTGMKYSTIIYHCKVGRLRARQHGPGCIWMIHGSEIERLAAETV